MDRIKTHKYLGIDIGDTLTWHSLLTRLLKKKVSVGLAVLKRAKAFMVSRKTFLITMYNALVQPTLTIVVLYGVVLANATLRDSKNYKIGQLGLFKLMTPSSSLLPDLDWDTLEQRKAKQLVVIECIKW